MSREYSKEELIYLARLAEQSERYDGRNQNVIIYRDG